MYADVDVTAHVEIYRRFVVRELSACEQQMRQSLSSDVHGRKVQVCCTEGR